MMLLSLGGWVLGARLIRRRDVMGVDMGWTHSAQERSIAASKPEQLLMLRLRAPLIRRAANSQTYTAVSQTRPGNRTLVELALTTTVPGRVVCPDFTMSQVIGGRRTE